MSVKTSQLQIRVTPAQKAVLKRLASVAGMSVSGYVLSQAIPSAELELGRLVKDLSAAEGAGQQEILERLRHLLAEVPPDEFARGLGHSPVEGLPPAVQNHVAAMIEQAAYAKAVNPPEWVDSVRPLKRPLFRWTLESLRPHQLRVAPVPFKRRNIFLDPSGATTTKPVSPLALSRLALLDAELAPAELKVEFYLLGGAVIFQAFAASPPTAHVSKLFRPAEAVRELVDRLGEREGWPSDWLTEEIEGCLEGGPRSDRFVELGNLSVFVPLAEYLLAVKVAALRVGAGPRELTDLQYVLRALNVSTVEHALSTVTNYFSERQLAAETRTVLERILPSA